MKTTETGGGKKSSGRYDKARTAPRIAVARGKRAALVADRAEDAADIGEAKKIRTRIAAGVEEALPFPMVKRLLSGESRVRVWREHRRLTQAGLAERAKLRQVNVSQIETGARAATVETLQRIARALDVSLDDVAPLPPED